MIPELKIVDPSIDLSGDEQTVEDTGPGIPEADRQRVKQRFFRLPDSTGHGSGLGLAIVEEIAQLYGAAVSINSGAGGRGTRIVVRFPAAGGNHRAD